MLFQIISIFSCCFIFIGYFIYLHFKCYALSWLHLQKPSTPSSLPLLLWGCSTTHPSIDFELNTLAFPYTGTPSLLKTKSLSSHWCSTRPSFATFEAGAMGPSMCTILLMVWSLRTLGHCILGILGLLGFFVCLLCFCFVLFHFVLFCFLANIHLLVRTYHACPFGSELPHSGWYFPVLSICLQNSGCPRSK